MNAEYAELKQVKDAIDALITPDEAERVRARARLVGMGKIAVPYLVAIATKLVEHRLPEALHEPGKPHYITHEERVALVAVVKTEAETVLAEIGEPALPALMPLLRSKEAGERDCAVRILSGIGTPAVPTLTEALRSADADERVAAASALSGIDDPTALNTLHETLCAAVAEARTTRRRFWLSRSLYIGGIVTVEGILYFGLHWNVGSFWIQIIIQSLFWGGFVDAGQKLRHNAISGLIKNAKPDSVGLFAACLHDQDSSVRKVARDALIGLLPQVQTNDRQHMTDAEMQTLVQTLRGRDWKLILATLKALEQIGDDKALPDVKTLAGSGRHHDTPMEVCEAAEVCLPFLQARADASRQAQTLLRPSQSQNADPAPQLLLRPSGAQPETPPEQLLRGGIRP